MMKFYYSNIAKLIYKYSYFLLTPLLLLYALISFGGIFKDSKFIIPFVINLLLLIGVIRIFIRVYRYFPFFILADNERIKCSQFMKPNKTVEIKMSEITSIKGGIFSGNPAKPIIIVGKNPEDKIYFNVHLKGYTKLLTLLLSNVNKDLYEDLMRKIREKNKLSVFLNKRKARK